MKPYLRQLTEMMSPPATPQWTARDPTFRSVVRKTVATRLAIIGLLALSPVAAEAITVTTTFDNLSANNSFNNQIDSPYESGDFNFASAGLFHYGTRHPDYPGSSAIYPFSNTGSIITVSRMGIQAFNFYAADFAARDLGAAKTMGLRGTRADGSQISASARLVGGMLVPQNFGIAGFTNLISLQFTGNDQLDRLVFSNLVPPPPSDATVNFDNAAIGTVGAAYSENGYQLSSGAPGGMGVQSTMNDSHGLGVAGTATIDLTHSGELFNLQGIVLDNIHAIPEPSSLLLVASAVVLELRRNGPRNPFRL